MALYCGAESQQRNLGPNRKSAPKLLTPSVSLENSLIMDKNRDLSTTGSCLLVKPSQTPKKHGKTMKNQLSYKRSQGCGPPPRNRLFRLLPDPPTPALTSPPLRVRSLESSMLPLELGQAPQRRGQVVQLRLGGSGLTSDELRRGKARPSM